MKPDLDLTAPKLTRAQLCDLDPCNPDRHLKLFGRRKSLTAAQALSAGATVENILWVAGRIGRKDLCVRFALACAQRVAHLNPDPRVQDALDATAAWLADPREKNRAAAAAAATWDAPGATWADDPARAAAEAAGAAEAVRAATVATWAAARDAETEAQRLILLEVFA